jgi:hypothetical protein
MPKLYNFYSSLIGYVGLAVEASLPFPQIFSNMRTKSCSGFRVSVIASWLAGDLMKMFWFFNATTEIPVAFKLCGIFQMCCDAFLALQYVFYGSGSPQTILSQQSLRPNGFSTHRPPSRVHTPMGEKEARLE